MKSNIDPRKTHESGDTLPDQAGVYVPPRPVAPISDHRTMDIKAIRLAAELDPRQARTQLRMQAPRRRRRVSPFWIASIGVVLLVGTGTYIALVTEAPLAPLEPVAPGPAVQPALPTGIPIDTVAPPPPPLSEVEKPPAPAGAEPPTRHLAPSEVEFSAEPPQPPPAPATTEAPPSPRSSPPRKAKPRQDPWLE
jgi:hypothetical protein